MISSLLLMMLAADVDLTTLPAPVRATLSSRWPRAKVTKIEIEEKNEVELELSMPDGAFEVTLGRDGALLGEERVVLLAATPTAVQKTIASWTGWTVERIERVTERKVVTFEVVARPAKGASMEIVLDSAGAELQRKPATE